MRNKEKIACYGLSDMGRQRTNNEDAFVAEHLDDNTVLAVAIDGVGGYEGGEIAAEIAKEEIPKYLREFQNGERIELLKQAVTYANNAIFERRQIDTSRSNMSCVLTSALIDKGRKVVDMVHVGDTRLYQYHYGILRKLSHDHSLVGYREEIGDLTEEQAMNHPQRNVISRDVGSDKHNVSDSDFLDAEEFPLLPNSTFLLCSDGLTDMITSRQIVAILEQNLSLEEKTQALIDAANEAGGKDNVTVVLVEYQAEEEEFAPIMDENENLQDDSVVEEIVAKIPKGKRVKGNKVILPILTSICILLLGSCFAILISSEAKDVRIHTLEEQLARVLLAQSTDKSRSDIRIDNSVLIQKVDDYTTAVLKNNFDALGQMYADTVRRFINYTNISKEKAVALIEDFDDKRGVTDKHLNVQWETWGCRQLPNGDVSVDFVEDFKVVKQDSTEVSYLVHCFMTFDTNGKIVSVLEDLLQSGEKLASK
ncbi:MAG: serine/threonine-protein phosphatase [Bacteroidales bacterium]|nr:serine/threonine-protein phosphatase [Bacteroidales bacterium]